MPIDCLLPIAYCLLPIAYCLLPILIARAWGARTVRATAAAMGHGAARRGAWGARTVRATAAPVGPGAVRGAWGGHGLGEGRGDIYVA